VLDTNRAMWSAYELCLRLVIIYLLILLSIYFVKSSSLEVRIYR